MSPESVPSAGKVSRRGLAVAGVAAALVVTVVVVNGVWSRNASEARLKEATNAQSIPVVAVIKPTVGGNKSTLDLPGRLEAYSRAPIYARVGGFLKAWYVDIGAPVKAGQLMAEIEAPDLDQQLLQAKAALASAQAAEALATVTAQRWPRSSDGQPTTSQQPNSRISHCSHRRPRVQHDDCAPIRSQSSQRAPEHGPQNNLGKIARRSKRPQAWLQHLGTC